MWNLFIVGSLQFPNDSTIASLEANQNRKRGIGGKFFIICFIVSWTSLTSSKGLLKLSTHACVIAWLGSAFILKEEATIPIFYGFYKKQKLNEKKCEKSFYCMLTLFLSV